MQPSAMQTTMVTHDRDAGEHRPLAGDAIVVRLIMIAVLVSPKFL